jgi:hypothetical protein
VPFKVVTAPSGQLVAVQLDEAVSSTSATSAAPSLLDPGEFLEYLGRPSQKKHMSQQLRADLQFCPLVLTSFSQMPLPAGTAVEFAESETYIAA